MIIDIMGAYEITTAVLKTTSTFVFLENSEKTKIHTSLHDGRTTFPVSAQRIFLFPTGEMWNFLSSAAFFRGRRYRSFDHFAIFSGWQRTGKNLNSLVRLMFCSVLCHSISRIAPIRRRPTFRKVSIEGSKTR